jgi:predicted TIM-barrel fold metal-dependent hydrolase
MIATDTITRRVMLGGAVVATSGAMAAGPARAAGTTKPRTSVPVGTCDSHVHVLDPARFPFMARRAYTPGPATVVQMSAMHAVLGISRVVVVQNSVYGSDNACLLDALAHLGPTIARGVATIDAKTTAQEIHALDRAGVRGVRLNLEVSKERDPAEAGAALDIAPMLPPHWHIHINAALPVLVAIRARIAGLGKTVVLDHFAHIPAAGGTGQPGFAEIVALMRSGKVIVKFSGPYQVSKQPGYGDIAPIARALVAAAPRQVIWGSDWPHTGGSNRPANQSLDVIEAFRPEDDGANFDLLAAWVPNPAARRRVLVETPAALYGFASARG